MNVSDIGKLLLRLTLGFLILLHGGHKVLHGIDKIEVLVARHHLPVYVAWGVYAGEVLAPLMVILGLQTRIGAMLIAINMAAAVFLSHMDEFLALTPNGGWALELQAFYFFTALALVFLGPGKFKLHS